MHAFTQMSFCAIVSLRERLIKDIMDTKETHKLYRSDNLLLADANYYKFIFKKTEKIVCVVFYLVDDTGKGHMVSTTEMLAGAASLTLSRVLATLTCRWYSSTGELLSLMSALVSLASNVRVARARNMLATDAADMLVLEIETVMRSLQTYITHGESGTPELATFDGTDSVGVGGSTRQRPVAPSTPPLSRVAPRESIPRVSARTSENNTSSKQRTVRRDAIRNILEELGESTIKDISDKMKECSEKTVQRELGAMVAEGIVQKKGERRWSQYSISASQT